MLSNKSIVLGITGSIAAYKLAILASMLKKANNDVTVIMTQNSTNFITPITFETLTGNKVLIDTFDRQFQYSVEHVALAKRADVFMIAPASANIIAKIAHGIADDMLTTTFLACKCPKIIAPAMNTQMYENPILKDNLSICRRYGMEIITPAIGYLACGDTGEGKMPEPEVLYEALEQAIGYEKDFKGRKVLVTAGPTREAIDPVRFISNHSTGKMGYSLARAARLRGADVTLVTGPCSLPPVSGVDMVNVISARDMAEAVFSRFEDTDIVIGAAAVADYRPMEVAAEKIKKTDGSLDIKLEKNPDILKTLGERKKPHQILIGFAMETENLLDNASEKLKKKNLDLIVANNLRQEGAGFANDTNIVTILSSHDTINLPLLSKDETAHRILDTILEKC